MSFFRIIIPNYNNEKWLDRCLYSVLGQSFRDFDLVFVDDVSTDGSVRLARDIIGGQGEVVQLYHKRWNGGARNVGLEYFKDAKYTLFLDSDDWFADLHVLQDLHDFLVDEDYPACVRLPYSIVYDGDKHVDVMLDDDNAEKLVRSMFVACWTLCVKSSLVVPFPENTLMEDAARHIRQCDVIPYEVPVFTKPVVVYNKNNSNSCSAKRNMDAQGAKWKSSMYRFMADLLDLDLTHDYCRARRDERAAQCLEHIRQGEYIQ